MFRQWFAETGLEYRESRNGNFRESELGIFEKTTTVSSGEAVAIINFEMILLLKWTGYG